MNNENRSESGESYVHMESEEHKTQVLVTKNSEYHLVDDECVAVRRGRGPLSAKHKAVGGQLIGLITPSGGLSFPKRVSPILGARVCFSTDLITSPLADVRRPRQQTLNDIRTLRRKGA